MQILGGLSLDESSVVDVCVRRVGVYAKDV